MPEDRFADARVVIVDDDPGVVLMLERILKDRGYRSIIGLTDPTAFAAVYEAQTPDLVLLDLRMPGVSGFELLAWVNARTGGPPRPPILVLTADVREEMRERALSDGAMDYLCKPLDGHEVLLRVHNLLARRFLEVDLWRHGQVLEQEVSERTFALRKSLEELRETSRQRHELALRLVTAQDEERRRIAADLHDGAAQVLVALKLRLGMLAEQSAGSSQRKEIAQAEHAVSDLLDELRSLMFELRTPTLGPGELTVALRDYVDHMRESGGPPVTLTIETSDELPTEAQAILFRIAQEALTNARKHAEAPSVAVVLQREGAGILLTVHDDGRGFDTGRHVEPGHLGLTLMKERATVVGGWCLIESAVDLGTTVRAWVPLDSTEHDPEP